MVSPPPRSSAIYHRFRPTFSTAAAPNAVSFQPFTCDFIALAAAQREYLWSSRKLHFVSSINAQLRFLPVQPSGQEQQLCIYIYVCLCDHVKPEQCVPSVITTRRYHIEIDSWKPAGTPNELAADKMVLISELRISDTH